MEEIEELGPAGVCLVDDLRWPCEFTKVRDRKGFIIRLVTASTVAGDPTVDGLLKGLTFDAEVPAKGLVEQAVLEKIIGDLWYDEIFPRVQRGP